MVVGGGDWPAYTPPRMRPSSETPSSAARLPSLDDSLWQNQGPTASQQHWKSWQQDLPPYDPMVHWPFNPTYTDLNAPHTTINPQPSSVAWQTTASTAGTTSTIMNVPVSINLPISFNVPVAISPSVQDAGTVCSLPSVSHSVSSPLVPILSPTYSPTTSTVPVTRTVSPPRPIPTVVRYASPAPSPSPVTVTQTVCPPPPISTVVRYASPAPASVPLTTTTYNAAPVARTVGQTSSSFTRTVIPFVPVASSNAPVVTMAPAYRASPSLVRPVLGSRSGSPHRQQLSPAAALDAADGVMDGKFFGFPIVQPSPTRRRLSYSYASDANRPRVIGVQYINHGPVGTPLSQAPPPPPPSLEQLAQPPSSVPIPTATPPTEEYVLAPSWDPQPTSPVASPPVQGQFPAVVEIPAAQAEAGPPDAAPLPVPSSHQEVVVRPWLGVSLKWLDDLDQGGRNNVAVVHEVIPGSPADKAGIQRNDQLEFWENTRLSNEAVWKAKMDRIRIGDVVSFGIHRDQRDQRVVVTVEGTSRDRQKRRFVASAMAVHTDN